MAASRRGIALGALIGGLGACLIKPGAGHHGDAGVGPGDSTVSDGTVEPPNLAFVTAGDYDVRSMTVSGMNAECTTLAGSGNFVAWYGTPGQSAMQRLGSARGWVRKDGLPFAQTADDIARGQIFYPLNVDESGATRMDGVRVATATNGDVTASYAGAGADCTQAASTGKFGVADGATGAWTDSGVDSCSLRYHLYCLQIDHIATVAVAPQPSAKRVWLSEQLYSAGLGRVVLDDACAHEGQQHNIASAFALLSDGSMSAQQRIIAGIPYARFDEVVVFDLARRRIAPINVTPTLAYLQGSAWAGARDFTVAGSAADSCAAWTGSAENACAGETARSLDAAFGGLSCSFNCGNNLLHLFCVQD